MKEIIAVFSGGCLMMILGWALFLGFWTGLIWFIIHLLKVNGIL